MSVQPMDVTLNTRSTQDIYDSLCERFENEVPQIKNQCTNIGTLSLILDQRNNEFIKKAVISIPSGDEFKAQTEHYTNMYRGLEKTAAQARNLEKVCAAVAETVKPATANTLNVIKEIEPEFHACITKNNEVCAEQFKKVQEFEKNIKVVAEEVEANLVKAKESLSLFCGIANNKGIVPGYGSAFYNLMTTGSTRTPIPAPIVPKLEEVEGEVPELVPEENLVAATAEAKK